MSPARAVLLGFVASGCMGAQPPPPYGLHQAESGCRHPVELLTMSQASRPAYRELERLSVTCPKLVPTKCEQLLLARGCVLGADAIVVQREVPITRGRLKYIAQMAEEAIAVRFAAR